MGCDIVAKSLRAPVRLIASNSGVEGDVIIEKLLGQPFEVGYNAVRARRLLLSHARRPPPHARRTLSHAHRPLSHAPPCRTPTAVLSASSHVCVRLQFRTGMQCARLACR